MHVLRSLVLNTLSLACLSAADASAGVVVERSATQRICQVTGETDRITGQPTVNATQSRFRFWGTDLGASFEHDGKTVFLFGDTHAMPGLDRAPDRDMIAVSTDSDPEDCLTLDVLTDDDGGFRPLSVAGIDGGAFSVPTGGFSAGGAMYVALTTDRSERRPMGRSVLARSSDGGRHFQPLYTLSTDHFISVAFAVAAEDGLPRGKAVLMWGSGNYRASDVRLATLPEDRPGERSTLRYFAGLDTQGKPVWSAREADSKPLFDQSCVGEMSAAWNADLAKWLILYNCGVPNNRILLRTADRPWGPWSPPQVVFDAQADGGYCRFMHRPDCGTNGLSDPHSPQVAGDPYAPAMIPRFSHGVAGSFADIYFLMSTWNPYNTMLMRTRLRIAPEPVTS